jgi:hypothetical protein
VSGQCPRIWDGICELTRLSVSVPFDVLPRSQLDDFVVPIGRSVKTVTKPATYRGRMIDSSEGVAVKCRVSFCFRSRGLAGANIDLQILHPEHTVYARGDYVSLHIQLASQQENAKYVLELLSSGSAATVCLIRTTTFGKAVETNCVAMGLCWTSEIVDSSAPFRTEGRQSERSASQRDSGRDERNRDFQTRIVHCEICVPSV